MNCSIYEVIYEYIDLAAMTFVITAWSLIFLVKGSARFRPVSTNLTVMPTWSTHFLTLSSKCWFILSCNGSDRPKRVNRRLGVSQ